MITSNARRTDPPDGLQGRRLGVERATPPRDTDAKTAVKSVLLAICLHTDDKNNQTVIGQESLAEELDISVRTVRRAVGVLDDLGVIQRERRYAEGGVPHERSNHGREDVEPPILTGHRVR